MNNKGFATSFILFSLLVLFLVAMGILVFTLNNSSKLNNKVKSQLINQMEDKFESDNRKINASDVEYDGEETKTGITPRGNTRVDINCDNLQCALDRISSLVSD